MFFHSAHCPQWAVRKLKERRWKVFREQLNTESGEQGKGRVWKQEQVSSRSLVVAFFQDSVSRLRAQQGFVCRSLLHSFSATCTHKLSECICGDTAAPRLSALPAAQANPQPPSCCCLCPPRGHGTAMARGQDAACCQRAKPSLLKKVKVGKCLRKLRDDI